MTYLNTHGEKQNSQKIVSMLSNGANVSEVAAYFGISTNDFIEQQIEKYALTAVTYTED